VIALQGELAGKFRLRVGEYRVIFIRTRDGIEVQRVLHRSSAYN
jgi:mRNA-degrading endonuclease RelE of RelBE toxin-antitoxin system